MSKHFGEITIFAGISETFLKSTILILKLILPGHQMIGQSPIRLGHAAVASARAWALLSHITQLARKKLGSFYGAVLVFMKLVMMEIRKLLNKSGMGLDMKCFWEGRSIGSNVPQTLRIFQESLSLQRCNGEETSIGHLFSKCDANDRLQTTLL